MLTRDQIRRIALSEKDRGNATAETEQRVSRTHLDSGSAWQQLAALAPSGQSAMLAPGHRARISVS